MVRGRVWGTLAQIARRATWVDAAVCVTLVLLCLHSAMYWFLTDDAFIPFRHACKLSHGYGLVLKSGFERVEGYADSLWVVLSAGTTCCAGGVTC